MYINAWSIHFGSFAVSRCSFFQTWDSCLESTLMGDTRTCCARKAPATVQPTLIFSNLWDTLACWWRCVFEVCVKLDIPHKHQDLSQTALSWCKFSLSSRTACFKSSWLSLYNWFPPPVAGVAPAGYFSSAGASGAVSSATFWSSVLVSSPLPPPAVRDQRAADSKAWSWCQCHKKNKSASVHCFCATFKLTWNSHLSGHMENQVQELKFISKAMPVNQTKLPCHEFLLAKAWDASLLLVEPPIQFFWWFSQLKCWKKQQKNRE